MINRRGMTVAKAAIAYADAKGVATLAEGEERDRFFEAEAPKLRAAGDHVQAERFEKEVGLHHKLAIDAVANSVLLPLLREGRLMIEGFPRGRTELALMPPEMVHDICNLDASGIVVVGFQGERGRWVALRVVDPVEAPAAIIVARAVQLAAPVMPDVHMHRPSFEAGHGEPSQHGNDRALVSRPRRGFRARSSLGRAEGHPERTGRQRSAEECTPEASLDLGYAGA